MNKKMGDKRFGPVLAIRTKCLECMDEKPSLVRKCDSEDCALHFYRFGKNPSRKGIGNHRVQETSIPFTKKVISAREFKNVSQNKSKDALLGDPQLKSPPNEEIAFSGKGDFRIEKAGKEYIIRLTQEEERIS